MLMPSRRESCLPDRPGHQGWALPWVPVPSRCQQDAGVRPEVSLQETWLWDMEVPLQRG